MKNKSLIALTCISLMLTSCNDEKKEIQNTTKAASYFADRLSFETNPHGVKMVVEGKVKNVVIVDVRDEDSYAKGHIPGAINIPYTKFNSFGGKVSDVPPHMSEDLAKAGLRKDGFNYVYCYEHLCNLSQKAAKKFAELGYPVKEIVGGFQSWKDHKYDIEKVG